MKAYNSVLSLKNEVTTGNSVDAMCQRVIQRMNETFKRGFKNSDSWFIDLAINHMHNIFRENRQSTDDIINQRYSYRTYSRIIKRSFLTVRVADYRITELKINYVDGGSSERLANICNVAFAKAINDIRMSRIPAFPSEGDRYEYKNFEKEGTPVYVSDFSNINQPTLPTEFNFDLFLSEMSKQTKIVTNIQF